MVKDFLVECLNDSFLVIILNCLTFTISPESLGA